MAVAGSSDNISAECPPRQPRHRELVGDIGNDRRRYAHADRGQQQGRISKSRDGVGKAYRGGHDRRDQYGRAKPVDPFTAALFRQTMAEHDIEHEQAAIDEGEQIAERRSREPNLRQEEHAAHREQQGGDVAWAAHRDGGKPDRPQKFDRANRRERQS
ncbi:hypothetical protein ACOJBO_17495 [Rhizobium beringeri]